MQYAQKEDQVEVGVWRRQQRKPSQAEAKPSQQKAKSSQKEAKSTLPRGVVTSSEKVHAKNLDVSKLAAEWYLDTEINVERLPMKIECKSEDLPTQRGGKMGPRHWTSISAEHPAQGQDDVARRLKDEIASPRANQPIEMRVLVYPRH